MVFISSEAPVLTLLTVLVGISLFHILLQFSSPYKFFYLFLQIPAILCIMPVIFLKTAVFPLITHVG